MKTPALLVARGGELDFAWDNALVSNPKKLRSNGINWWLR
jgi:hypothetical protein